MIDTEGICWSGTTGCLFVKIYMDKINISPIIIEFKMDKGQGPCDCDLEFFIMNGIFLSHGMSMATINGVFR